MVFVDLVGSSEIAWNVIWPTVFPLSFCLVHVCVGGRGWGMKGRKGGGVNRNERQEFCSPSVENWMLFNVGHICADEETLMKRVKLKFVLLYFVFSHSWPTVWLLVLTTYLLIKKNHRLCDALDRIYWLCVIWGTWNPHCKSRMKTYGDKYLIVFSCFLRVTLFT